MHGLGVSRFGLMIGWGVRDRNYMTHFPFTLPTLMSTNLIILQTTKTV